jgi:type II secretory pathway predicted ATPase ExeA
LLEELDRMLRERRALGQISALVIDEAQSMSAELLEEIRLLGNSETATEKLLPLVLAGQPELRDRLNEPGLRQLKQRVTLRCEIHPFRIEGTAAYIAARVRTAGGDAARLFSREAVMLIHEHSRGIPRTISVLCDNSLVSGMALECQPVTRTIVSEVCRDFRLNPGKQPSAAPHTEGTFTEPPQGAASNGSEESAADPRHPMDVFRRNRNRFGAVVSR